MRAAIITPENTVANVIVLDDLDDYQLPEGHTLDVIPDGVSVGPGWTRTGQDTFTEPAEEPVDPDSPPTTEQTLAAATAAARIIIGERVKGGKLKPGEANKIAAAFPTWRPNEDVATGDLRYFDGDLVEAVQPHTTQDDWRPPDVPALWKVWRDVGSVEPWVQPGSTNPYPLGAKVTHKGKTWESINAANVWEPPTQWREVT